MSNKDRFGYLDDRRMASWRKKSTVALLNWAHQGWRGRNMVDKILAERGFDPNNLPAPGAVKDLAWFKLKVAPLLTAYDIKYHETLTGDLGTLKQAEFESDTIGGNVDFWSMGWLGIFVWDYTTEKELMNILIEPVNTSQQYRAFTQLFALLSIDMRTPD